MMELRKRISKKLTKTISSMYQDMIAIKEQEDKNIIREAVDTIKSLKALSTVTKQRVRHTQILLVNSYTH
jgi:hypothetical protein